MKNKVKTFDVNIIDRKDPAKQLSATTLDVSRELDNILNIHGGFKFLVTVKITSKRKAVDPETGEDYFVFKDGYFNSTATAVLNKESIIDYLRKADEEILNIIASWISEGSGWVIELITEHWVNVASYIPLKGTSYIPLPEELKNYIKKIDKH